MTSEMQIFAGFWISFGFGLLDKQKQDINVGSGKLWWTCYTISFFFLLIKQSINWENIQQINR